MTTRVFSIREALRFGWNTANNNLGFFIGLSIVFGLLFIFPAIIAGIALQINTFLGIIFHIADYALTLLISIGLVKIALRFCDGEKSGLSDLFSQYRLFFKYLFTYILYGLIIFGGTLLLIVPGIIWAIKYQFCLHLVIDKGLGPIESLKTSAILTKGVKWRLYLFSLVAIGINIVGALSMIVGLFVTVPTTMVALAFIYRKLLAQTQMTPMS